MKSKSECETQEIRDFRLAMRAMVSKVRRQLREEERCCGVGNLTSAVLLELDGSEGCALKDLVSALATDKAALSRAVDLLVKDGLVTRKENVADRRAVVITLTDSGRAKVAEINDYCDEKYRCLLGTIPEAEHAAVFRALALVGAALDTDLDIDRER